MGVWMDATAALDCPAGDIVYPGVGCQRMACRRERGRPVWVGRWGVPLIPHSEIRIPNLRKEDVECWRSWNG